MALIAGIDEAGRGSLIGPLVVCCASCERSDERKLKKSCKKDSKKLSPKQREEKYAELKQFVTFKWVEISAGDLNHLMKKLSLNDIEAKVMAKLSKELKDADIIIDLPDRYSWTFRKRMDNFGFQKFEAEHKADENYSIVAAASICAKVTRDHKIEEIHQLVGDFGSGYPSDSKTINAIKDKQMCKALKVYTRERWKTLENIKQKKLFEDEE